MGPSPLTRGSPSQAHAGDRGERSIPAHAGQPRSSPRCGSPPTVHPRSRGAAARGATQMQLIIGPSPLTRGSQVRKQPQVDAFRSIPAHAGQPVQGGDQGARHPVHPRSRGAAPPRGVGGRFRVGPSPLTRGSQGRVMRQCAPIGSIPAHAGQPARRRVSPPRSAVHPRSRGAALLPSDTTGNVRGPSPLTRGSPRVLDHRQVHEGSIPAHAGQPDRTNRARFPRWVHPRSRGAAKPRRAMPAARRGPSPLTRGSRIVPAVRVARTGSIPAHAGQPSENEIKRPNPWVHPRSRGAAIAL